MTGLPVLVQARVQHYLHSLSLQRLLSLQELMMSSVRLTSGSVSGIGAGRWYGSSLDLRSLSTSTTLEEVGMTGVVLTVRLTEEHYGHRKRKWRRMGDFRIWNFRCL